MRPLALGKVGARTLRLLAVALSAAAVGHGGTGGATPLEAQSMDSREEGRLLREAAALEGRGEQDEAERVLRELLDRVPTSSGGLFALERVLRARGRVAEVLPAADRYLEREPRGSGIRYLKLRVLVEIDSLAAVEDEAERWIAAEPGSSDPWQELARIYETAFGPERALALLRRGQETLGDPASLALEVGDLLARLGRPDEAVESWSRAIGEAGQGTQGVVRRLTELPGPAPELARSLVAALDVEPTTVGRRRAAVQIAVDVGLEAEAVEMAGRVLTGLTLGARRGFLTELARQAEDRGAATVSLWAYRTLRARAGDAGEVRALDARIAAAALAAGDTAQSIEARERVVRALPEGSPERMRAMEGLVRMGAGREEPALLVERLQTFRREFPDAPGLDPLVSAVAAHLRARGLTEEASAVLQGVEGPRSALERGYLMLEEGDVEAARATLGEAAQGLTPEDATEVIQLLSLLERLQPPSAALVVRASLLARQGDPAGSVSAVADLADVPDADRPAILAHGARLADGAGLADEAARLRARIIAEHPDAPERGEASLALARQRAAEPGGLAEAVRILEALIVDRPAAAVVPGARRELQRLRSRSGGGRP